MNASPSAQSVGSQKPSTAASNASGKRTRTIIVARNLPDAPLAPVSTSSSTSQSGRHTSSHGAHHHHHGGREAKPVKLNSYAALGSDADVELYERFLSEKKSSAPTTEGMPASGNASPVLVKRRTMGQLPIHSNTSSNSKLETPQTEEARDAKQRREAVMQHRKWLKSLPIHERLAYERQQNVIKKWKQINREWEDFKSRTSKKLGKSEKQLVMSRASEYREQVEMYDALQRAMPLSEKVGEDFWLVSLRSEGTRYVPVGNIFSGLYCPIRESSKLQPRVRRPLDYQDAVARSGEDGDGLGHDKPLTTLERRSMEALARKKRRLKKQLHALFPHEVEPSQSGQLRVDTEDLFEWASASQPAEFGDYDNNQLLNTTASTRSLLLPLNEEENQENNADGLNSRRSTARSRHTARSRPRKGPSMRVFLGDSPDETEGGEQTLELSFFTDIDVAQQQHVYLENDGTTSLQFQWRRMDVVDAELGPRLTKHHASPLEDPRRIAWTSISLREGIVLPGELIEFVFTFQSTRAGTWLEKWLLDVDPPLPHLTNKREAVACVQLQCTAVDNYVPTTQRKKLRDRTAQAETTFMAEQVLKHDVIQKVDPQYAIEFPELDDHARLFYDNHRRGAYESVQYSQKLMAASRELYETALAILQPPSAAVHVEETPSSSTPSTPRETTDASAALPVYPSDWDMRLTTLRDVVLAADSRLQSDFMALKAQQIAERQQQGASVEDEEDEEEEDLMERILGTKARKKEEQQAALRALEPHLLSDFQSLVAAAKISPYEPRLLSETLAEKLASMAGETPIVLEIAKMQSQSRSEEGAREEACALLGPLLIRAIDESFAVDQQRERVFEDAKRHFHSVVLSSKRSFSDLPVLLSASQANHNPSVVFFQVDLDIANWFTLSPAADGTFLEWKLAQKLLDHETHVPPKIRDAVKSIETVAETVVSSGLMPVLVLVSELSPPPMNKAMKKMEIAFATARATAAKASSSSDDTTPPSPADIEMVRQKLEQKRNKLLSLRGVDSVVQRALSGGGLTIEFVSSLDELEASCREDQTRPSSGDAESATDLLQQPRIVLIDHLGALARQALKPTKPADTSSATAAAAPPTDKAKTPVAPVPTTDKKKSLVGAPSVQIPQGSDPAEDEDDRIDVLPGMSLEMMAAQALGQRLGQLGNVLVVDFFPQSWWEATFVYFTAPPPLSATRLETPPSTTEDGEKVEEVAVEVTPKHVLVGPQLVKSFSKWRTIFQRDLPTPTTASVPMKAVVGGRGLERKLRLLDGLLERVDTVYFVGDLAMTIFRVLHTKQVIQSTKRERRPVARYEYQRLIAPVERLIQKAYRKQVELLLPLDFVVGDSRVDVDAAIVAGDDDGEDDEAEEEEEEEEDEDDDDDDSSSRKKKAKKPKVRVQKPLEEPPEIDTWQPRSSYDGDRGLVEFKAEISETWIRLADVTEATIRKIRVVEGNASLLEPTDAAEDAEHSIAASPKPVVLAELDWTHRVFDIGPKSTQLLLEQLTQQEPSWLFVNGTLGVVEFREFDVATKKLLHLVETTPQLNESMLLTGKSTATWLRQLGQQNGKAVPGVRTAVSSSTAKNAPVLSFIVEIKPHAMLTAFDSV